MKEPVASSPLRIDDPLTAAVFANPAERRILLAFAEADRSIGEAVAVLGLPLSRVHYYARRLAALGLVSVVRLRKRGGRPIKIYRASARAYFVPLALLPPGRQPELAGDLRDALERRRMSSAAGLLVTPGRDGRINLRHVGETGGEDAADIWLTLPLAPAEARTLARGLRALALRYADKAGRGRGRRPYILRIALAGRLQG